MRTSSIKPFALKALPPLKAPIVKSFDEEERETSFVEVAISIPLRYNFPVTPVTTTARCCHTPTVTGEEEVIFAPWVSKVTKPSEVLNEFLDTFDVGGEKDGKVTRNEFENYYTNIGASIDNDDYWINQSSSC